MTSETGERGVFLTDKVLAEIGLWSVAVALMVIGSVGDWPVVQNWSLMCSAAAAAVSIVRAMCKCRGALVEAMGYQIRMQGGAPSSPREHDGRRSSVVPMQRSDV